jgi:hypothetical protein
MEDKRLAANPSGLCMCGCGRKTKIVTKSDRRHGHVMGQPFRFIHGHSRPAPKGPNRFKLRRRTAVIFLERRDGTVLECLVSRKDFHRVSRHHWYANKNGKRASHAVARIDGAQVQMHKHLCPNWAQVNHQNGNGLDKFFLVAAAGAAYHWLKPSQAKLAFQPYRISRLTSTGNVNDKTISRDGRYLAYQVTETAGDSLWVQQIATATNVRMLGPVSADLSRPSFSIVSGLRDLPLPSLSSSGIP